MAQEATKIPDFQQPKEQESPIINTLLHEHFVLENSIDYSCFKLIHALDPLQLSKSNSAVFMFKDEHGFVDCRRIFLALDFYATKEDDEPLTGGDFIGGTNVAAHSVSTYEFISLSSVI